MRFNPPPNWPTPPAGWTPPPGWQPDPSLPPPPAGWQLWVSDPSAPGQQPGSNRTPWIIGGGVAVLALVGLAVGLFFGLKSDGGSAEDQIRASVKKSVIAINAGDSDALMELACAAQKDDVNQSDWDDAAIVIKAYGAADMEVLSIDFIDENTAKAKVRYSFANDASSDEDGTINFVKESGSWKQCR